MYDLWCKIDDHMQDWYMSMPDPWRSIVMGGIGLAIGVVVIIGIMLMVGGRHV